MSTGRIVALEEAVSALTQRLEAVENGLLALTIQPEADGWITNGYPDDEETRALLTEEYGGIVVGEPRPTSRTVAELKADGICGLYVVRQ